MENKKTLFKTGHGIEINEVEVMRVSDKSVYFMRSGKEQRELINTEWNSYHKTKEDAIDFLVAQQKSKIQNASQMLEKQNKILIQILEKYSQ